MKIIDKQVKVGNKLYHNVKKVSYSGGRIIFIDSEDKEHNVSSKYAKSIIKINPEDKKSIAGNIW